jgi:hypothetical protein
VATPAKRRKLMGSSKLPNNGVMPRACNSGTLCAELVSASSRLDALNKPATRKPTSPQPTIKTRGLLNRAGKAPRGLRFEGKISSFGW